MQRGYLRQQSSAQHSIMEGRSRAAHATDLPERRHESRAINRARECTGTRSISLPKTGLFRWLVLARSLKNCFTIRAHFLCGRMKNLSPLAVLSLDFRWRLRGEIPLYLGRDPIRGLSGFPWAAQFSF